MEDVPTSDAFDYTELTDIIHNNHRIRRKVQEATNQFLASQNELLQQLQKETFDKTISDKFDLLIDTLNIQSMNEQVVADKVQLALVGENSSGKTALIHYLLESDSFLPSYVGSVSARIIRLTYEDAANACLRVYSSLKDRHKEPYEVSLSEYFSEPEPVWGGVRAKIAEYVTRPKLEENEKHSEIFADWARKFVEIRIPSMFLKLGIDLYDTPGLHYSDPSILEQNLHDLVETIVPTVVFTYENSAITSATKDCFLALKKALGKKLGDTSIFFLNTKTDIGMIISANSPISTEQFEKTILVDARKKRKDLLLKVPNLAQQIFESSEFDIISVKSQLHPLGIKMNQLTINHLIQFVANSDLTIAKHVIEMVLPVINLFFDFASVVNHRTREQLQHLRRKAYEWIESYFIDYQNLLDRVLQILYDCMIKELNDKMDSIIQRAIKQSPGVNMEKYIRTLVQQEIIQTSVGRIVNANADILAIHTFVQSSLFQNVDKNELLDVVQRMFVTLSSVNTEDRISTKRYNATRLVTPLIMIRDILIETDDEDNENDTNNKREFHEIKKCLRQKVIRKSRPSKSMERIDLAQQFLSDIRRGFLDQKASINALVGQWCEFEKNRLQEKINQQYKLAEQWLPQREKVYRIANKYVEQFACIECKLSVAQSLTEFNGNNPVLKELIIDEDKFFQYYSAEWGDRKDFIVKKFKDISNLQYLEAHNYQQLSKLNISGLLTLSYLYLNDDNELWMFFSKYECLDYNTKQLTIKEVLSILLVIAKCLKILHENEFIHGNVHIKNIYRTSDEKYILGDFYSTKNYENALDCINRHKMNVSIQESANDIFTLGQVGMTLYESLKTNEEASKVVDDLKCLLGRCMDEDPVMRPSASRVVEILIDLSEKD
ncbi:unnamed protein product [Rotaria sp. Silwood1]|nr:unnamed protein product [Rotaria sp. Silwood1]